VRPRVARCPEGSSARARRGCGRRAGGRGVTCSHKPRTGSGSGTGGCSVEVCSPEAMFRVLGRPHHLLVASGCLRASSGCPACGHPGATRLAAGAHRAPVRRSRHSGRRMRGAARRPRRPRARRPACGRPMRSWRPTGSRPPRTCGARRMRRAPLHVTLVPGTCTSSLRQRCRSDACVSRAPSGAL